MTRSLLDPGQILQSAFDADTSGLKTTNVSGSLITVAYDSIELTYLSSGNGSGQVGTVTYKLSGSTVATLTLTYDGSNRLSTVTKS